MNKSLFCHFADLYFHEPVKTAEQITLEDAYHTDRIFFKKGVPKTLQRLGPYELSVC
jgi:hypothetical protein